VVPARTEIAAVTILSDNPIVPGTGSADAHDESSGRRARLCDDVASEGFDGQQRISAGECGSRSNDPGVDVLTAVRDQAVGVDQQRRPGGQFTFCTGSSMDRRVSVTMPMSTPPDRPGSFMRPTADRCDTGSGRITSSGIPAYPADVGHDGASNPDSPWRAARDRR
jgi:hypothetical protein